MEQNKPPIAIDLDGVLASYKEFHGWENIGDPIPGAVDFVRELSKDYQIIIYTARLNCPSKDYYTIHGLITDWLIENGFSSYISSLEKKIVAKAYIDDRAVTCIPERTSIEGDPLSEAKGRLYFDFVRAKVKLVVNRDNVYEKWEAKKDIS